jgi:methylglutaconyl-CoA hydratase
MPDSAPRTDFQMEGGHVTTTVDDGIATIRFGHPKGNSLPGAVLAELARTIRTLGTDDAARVIVLRSDGTGPFCAGASFAELQAIADVARGTEFFMGFARVILAMRSCPKFVIARVHGKAVGGGIGLVAAADYAIATNAAAVKLSELAVGIGPFVVGPVIERKMGLGGLQALGVDAANFRDAEWAERRGLYAKLVGSPAELDAAVDDLARTLARSNPAAMALMKAAFWRGTEEWETLLPERAAMSGTLVLSEFTKRALAAFAQRA